MEVTGLIVAVLQKREGDTERGHWESQQFVAKYFDPENPRDQYGKHLLFTVFGSDRLKQYNIELNKEYKISFDVDAVESRKTPGQWFGDNRAWNVVPVGAAAQPSTAENASSLI